MWKLLDSLGSRPPLADDFIPCQFHTVILSHPLTASPNIHIEKRTGPCICQEFPDRHLINLIAFTSLVHRTTTARCLHHGGHHRVITARNHHGASQGCAR